LLIISLQCDKYVHKHILLSILYEDCWLEIKCFEDHCLSFIDLRLLSTPICSVVLYHNSVLSVLMTYHRTFYNSNITGATSGEGTALLFRTHHRHEFTTGFCLLRCPFGFFSLAIELSVLIIFTFLITSLVFSKFTWIWT